MRLLGTHFYKRVSPPVHPSITPVQKPHFSAVFGYGEILLFLCWIKWSTNMFWEPPLLLCRFICLFVHLSLHICNMFNSHRDTVRTHRYPVGLASIFLWRDSNFWYSSSTIRINNRPHAEPAEVISFLGHCFAFIRAVFGSEIKTHCFLLFTILAERNATVAKNIFTLEECCS